MGYVCMMANCGNCGMLFGFNPNKVPSVRVEGQRIPVCESCVKWANSQRLAAGLPLIDVQPGAYDEVDENEVNWDA